MNDLCQVFGVGTKSEVKEVQIDFTGLKLVDVVSQCCTSLMSSRLKLLLVVLRYKLDIETC